MSRENIRIRKWKIDFAHILEKNQNLLRLYLPWKLKFYEIILIHYYRNNIVINGVKSLFIGKLGQFYSNTGTGFQPEKSMEKVILLDYRCNQYCRTDDYIFT